MVNLRLEHVRLARLHARALRPLRPGRDGRRARGLRAVDAPEPRAHDAHGERPRGGARAPHRGRAHQRRPRGAAARLRRAAPRPGPYGIAGIDRARPRRCCRGVDVETDLGAVDRPRDARPRAVARLPVPARAAAAHLRRPPARPRLALLRLRLHARPGRRVPATRSTSSRTSTRGCACAGHGRTFTDVQAPHRRPTARSCAERVAEGPRRRDLATARSPRSTPSRASTAQPIDADERQLVAERDALLPAPPRGDRARRADRRRRRRRALARHA